MRDLTATDRDPHMARANEEQLVERLVFLGQRRAPGDIAEPTGDEQPGNLWIARRLSEVLSRPIVTCGFIA